MKRVIIFAAIAALAFSSCSKTGFDNSVSSGISRISFAGDYVDISTSPLTKAGSSQTYYAFEIDSLHIVKCQEKNHVWYDTTYCHYAEALFTKNNVANLSVNLMPGYKYRVRCEIIGNQEDNLYVESGSYVREPFASETFGYGSKTRITNEFVYSANQTLWTGKEINNIVCVNNGERVRYAKVDRYFGEMETEGGNIVLNMTRQNFGIHLRINPPKEGTLKVYHDYDYPHFSYTLSASDSAIDEQHVYNLGSNHNSYTNTDSFANLYLKVEWMKANGTKVDLSPATLKLYNKTMTTINVNATDNQKGGGDNGGNNNGNGGNDGDHDGGNNNPGGEASSITVTTDSGLTSEEVNIG